MTQLALVLFAQVVLRFGAPACNGELSDHKFFLVCYDPVRKLPSWTAHELTPHQIPAATSRPRYFRQDTAARNTDYRGSGFSRGHMVPAEDLAWSDESMQSTYVLSNVVPQRQSVNSGVWRELEAAIRMMAARSDAVIVFTGPIFAGPDEQHIGERRIAVPTHTFKVVLALEGGRQTMFAAIVPNGPGGSLDEFTTSVGEVERLTGLDFFMAVRK